MFSEIYNILYVVGLKTHRYIKRFFLWLVKIVKKPIKAIGTVFFAIFLVVDKFLLKTVKLVVGEIKELSSDFKRVFKRIVYICKNEKSKAPKVLFEYFKKAFQNHRIVFSYALNLSLPIAAFVLMWNVMGMLANNTLALQIKYNGSTIGYVKSEAVYLEAQNLAKQRLSTAASVVNVNKSNAPLTEYNLTYVKLTDLKDSTVICDKIIETSDSHIINACGIYIDNEFICAVKNETDAITVFDNILKDYNTGDATAVASFVEEVSYVQGLYPDNENTIWDAVKLEEKLKSKKNEALYYTVLAGDTISGIAGKMDTTMAKLKALNPTLVENIHIGDKLLVSSEVNFIRVKVSKTESRTEVLRFDREEIKAPNLYVGTKRVMSKGVNGEQQITELVTYIDGVKVSAKELSRVTTKEAVTERTQIGTKRYGYGGYFGGDSSYPVQLVGGRMGWPAIGATVVSSGYGGRSMGWHTGVDLTRPGGSTGAPVVASASGTVVTAGGGGSYGNHVIISHGNGVQTLYAHMLRGSIRVSPGQKVSAGQVLGNIGATGNVTGPHLHFEVRINGKAVNPLPYIRG
ncbi:MAG: peptidoglycan DD-metalloendopeptidase family protein [Oscillospiraceae bacterium]